MGESACLVQPFGYGSGIGNGSKQKNPMHALGDSVSFGRFMSESISWEKWSTFSHKSYVEEAERYAQPGSVAQKKAFFEAHYRSIAAKKAAALLEQANAVNNNPKSEFEHQSSDNPPNHHQVPGNQNLDCIVNGSEDSPGAEQDKIENGNVKVIEGEVLVEYPLKEESLNQYPFLEGFKTIPPSQISKTKPKFLSSNSAIHQRAPRVPASPAKHAAPASEQDESSNPDAWRIDSSSVAPSPYKESKHCKTPLSTPIKASANGVLVNPSATPGSESKRSQTQLDISTSGSKKTAPKWHILSTLCSKSFSACRNKLQSPILSSPFSLRTEERASRRKQLEEKFNANEGQKVQLQTRLKEKAEKELRKLRQSLCFRAQPLPDLYKERKKAKDQMNSKLVHLEIRHRKSIDPYNAFFIQNTAILRRLHVDHRFGQGKGNRKWKDLIPLPHPNSPKLGRREPNSSPLQGITSPPPETASSKRSCAKNFLKKKSQITIKSDCKSVLFAP